MVHQNATYFERCHAADFDPAVHPAARSACWARWLTYYREGQPSSRVRFAEARLAALRSGKPTAPMPGMQGASLDAAYTGAFLGSEADGTSDGTADADAAAKSNAPSKTLDEPALPSPPATRSSACVPVCEPQWNACARRCDGQPDACIRSCEVEFRTCASACN